MANAHQCRLAKGCAEARGLIQLRSLTSPQVCKECVDIQALPKSDFRFCKIFEQRQVTGERGRRLAQPISFRPIQQRGMVALGRTVAAASGQSRTANGSGQVEPDQRCGARQCKFGEPAIDAFDDPFRFSRCVRDHPLRGIYV